MEFPERMSARITAAISEYLDNVSEEKLAEINYGIAAFITNSYKTILIFIMAYFLNIFRHFLVAFVSFGALRTFASGVHAKREWTCLPASILLFFGVVFLGRHIILNNYTISFIFALCFTAVLLYAPADTEERPLVSKKLRKKLKILSLIAVAILYTAAVCFADRSASSIITFSVLIESILILPVTYNLVGSLYGVGIKINNKREV